MIPHNRLHTCRYASSVSSGTARPAAATRSDRCDIGTSPSIVAWMSCITASTAAVCDADRAPTTGTGAGGTDGPSAGKPSAARRWRLARADASPAVDGAGPAVASAATAAPPSCGDSGGGASERRTRLRADRAAPPPAAPPSSPPSSSSSSMASPPLPCSPSASCASSSSSSG
eukprot:350327-Chlamydomonas_euryale.AAC.5